MVQQLTAASPGEPIVQILAGKIRNTQLLDAFRNTNRVQFLDNSLRPHASSDRALPIGHAQTTSQPLVIARMLDMMLKNAALRPPPALPLATVLEVGAGCGYQSALLAQICDKVIAMERIAALAKQTATRLRTMRHTNVRVIHQDGFGGYPSAAPFDGIIICAEHHTIPATLTAQLAENATMIMPLTSGDKTRLVAINAEGKITQRSNLVSFVPMLEGKS